MGRGCGGRVTPRLGRAGGWRMTGSADTAIDVVILCGSKMGKGAGRGDSPVWLDRRMADDGKRWYSGGRCVRDV